MYIVAGSAMVALGLVGVSLLAWLFRSSITPAWLSSDLAAMLLCIPVTALMGLGGGYVFIGLSHGVGMIEVLALVGCAAVPLGAPAAPARPGGGRHRRGRTDRAVPEFAAVLVPHVPAWCDRPRIDQRTGQALSLQ